MTEARSADATPTTGQRTVLIGRALQLEYLTVGWSLIEAGVGVAAAFASGSVALLGFGLDSLVESASGGVLIWRLTAEARAAMCLRRDGQVHCNERLADCAHAGHPPPGL